MSWFQLLWIIFFGQEERKVHDPQEVEGWGVTHYHTMRLQELCTLQAKMTQQWALRAEKSQMKGAFVSALCFFVWQLTQNKPLTTVWWEPAAIRSRSPGLASVHFSSSSVTDEDSSFFRGDFNVPSALTSTRLSSLTHEEKTQLVTFY